MPFTERTLLYQLRYDLALRSEFEKELRAKLTELRAQPPQDEVEIVVRATDLLPIEGP